MERRRSNFFDTVFELCVRNNFIPLYPLKKLPKWYSDNILEKYSFVCCVRVDLQRLINSIVKSVNQNLFFARWLKVMLYSTLRLPKFPLTIVLPLQTFDMGYSANLSPVNAYYRIRLSTRVWFPYNLLAEYCSKSVITEKSVCTRGDTITYQAKSERCIKKPSSFIHFSNH